MMHRLKVVGKLVRRLTGLAEPSGRARSWSPSFAGSGKTTMLNCCTAELDPELRVVVAEEVFDADISLANVVQRVCSGNGGRLFARPLLRWRTGWRTAQCGGLIHEYRNRA